MGQNKAIAIAIEIERLFATAGVLVPEGFGEKLVSLVRDIPKKPPAKAGPSSTWQAYADCYKETYGREIAGSPMLYSVCRRIETEVGKDEAPRLVEFYFTIKQPWIVEHTHPLAVLLRDAQAIMTRMVTGRPLDKKSTIADKNAELMSKKLQEMQGGARRSTSAVSL